jgi:hypothetical protein
MLYRSRGVDIIWLAVRQAIAYLYSTPPTSRQEGIVNLVTDVHLPLKLQFYNRSGVMTSSPFATRTRDADQNGYPAFAALCAAGPTVIDFHSSGFRPLCQS